MTINDAKQYIDNLVKEGLNYHYEDGAIDSLFKNGLCTLERARTIEAAVDQIRSSDLDWGEDQDIFGYTLRNEEGS